MRSAIRTKAGPQSKLDHGEGRRVKAPSRVSSSLLVYYEVIKHSGGERLRNNN